MINKDFVKFIVIDGPNGSGKTSVAAELYKIMDTAGLQVVLTKEPTDDQFGNFIRFNESYLSPSELFDCVVANRVYHVKNKVGGIEQILAYSKSIICERYTMSNLALQFLDGFEMPSIWKKNCGFPIPDITFFLHAPVKILHKRVMAKSSLSRFESSFTRQLELEAFQKAANFLQKEAHFSDDTPCPHYISEIDTSEITPLEAADRIFGVLKHSVFKTDSN